MADKPLFILDAKGRWRLAYDRQQWVLQRRAGSPGRNRSGIRESGWRGVSFVGSKKATLERIFREKDINLTAEALTRFDALPDQFLVFLAEIDSPRPENAGTARSRPSEVPTHLSATERPPTDVACPRRLQAT